MHAARLKWLFLLVLPFEDGILRFYGGWDADSFVDFMSSLPL